MLGLSSLMSSYRHKKQIFGDAFHLLFVLSLEYCCPIVYRSCLTSTAYGQLLFCEFFIPLWARGYILTRNSQQLTRKLSTLFSFVWVLITCYCRFVAVHNCTFLCVTSGTKPKLAAQWEIIPNKSPINSWWIHASSEKEEDELDWCTRWCFLHGYRRNQVRRLDFSEDLREVFWFLFHVRISSADLLLQTGCRHSFWCLGG